MTRPAGPCPNCGAPIEFRWSSAVQTVCPHCKSVVVRHDVNLAAIGEVSDLPADSSPIQIGTEGRWADQPFTVVGRIVYEHDDGGWNEWHLIFGDGSSGWLSDAQAEYAVSRLTVLARPLPERHTLVVGRHLSWEQRQFEVTTLTEARYKGVEGELPFEYWGKDAVLFADLRSHDASFATIDYSEQPPLLFVGQFVEYDALRLRHVREFDARAQGPVTRGFNCANCGAPVELRALQHTRSVACTSCAAILDPNDPTLVVLQQASGLERVVPTIPLGTRGTLRGRPCEVVGFQRRSISVDDEVYRWNEYVLFNPYQGFRYLSEYQGHWSDIRAVPSLPIVTGRAARPAANYGGRTYRHFQSATAATEFVLGEFPWRVRAHDSVEVADFISPPMMLSREGTSHDATWSLGEYTTGADVWASFALPDSPPAPVGIFANQPSPYAGRVSRQWRTFAWLALALLILLVGRTLTAAREEVFAHDYVFRPGAGEAAFVTEPFTIRAPGTVEFSIDTSIQNSWVYFDLALVNAETGTALNVAREISQYSGTDSDGAWSEGSSSARVLIPPVPAGEYYLRVEPDNEGSSAPVTYHVRLRRDVMSLWPYGLALALLAIGPIWASVRSAGFETRRWQESDHAS